MSSLKNLYTGHVLRLNKYQNGGFAEPVSTGVHSNIDNLMLQEKLDNTYDPGVMYAHRTLGQRVADWIPSQHKDPIKAKEQERGLQEFIDFFTPQTKTELALEVIPGAGLIKHVARKAPDIAKMVKKAGITSPLTHHTTGDRALNILKEGRIKGGEGEFPGKPFKGDSKKAIDAKIKELEGKTLSSADELQFYADELTPGSPAVSLTRDPSYLTRSHGHVGTDVSFIFDRPSLRKYGYKIEPFAESGFQKTRPNIYKKFPPKKYNLNWMNPRFEFEERVRGNLSLKDLKMINVNDIYLPISGSSKATHTIPLLEELVARGKKGTPIILSNKFKDRILSRLNEIKFEDNYIKHGKPTKKYKSKLERHKIKRNKEKKTLKSLLKLPSYKDPFKKSKPKHYEKWAEEEDLLKGDEFKGF